MSPIWIGVATALLIGHAAAPTFAAGPASKSSGKSSAKPAASAKAKATSKSTAKTPAKPPRRVAPSPDPNGAFRLLQDPQVAQDLRLTTGQLLRIREEKYKFLRSAIELRARVSLARLDLDQTLETGDTRHKRSLDIVARITQVEKDLNNLLVLQTADQSKILTAKQREKFVGLLKDMRRRAHAQPAKAPASKIKKAAAPTAEDLATAPTAAADWRLLLEIMEEVYADRQKK